MNAGIRATILAFLVLCATAWAQNPSMTTFTNPNGHIIYNMSVTTGPVTAGYPVNVTLRGEPGGLAHFDIGPYTDILLTEGPPGIYRGSYLVNANDNLPAAPVVAFLSVGNGSASFTADNAVALLGSGVADALIFSTSHTGGHSLYPGQTMSVTMVGLPDGVATFDVGRHKGLPMQEYAAGNYIGYFTCAVGDVQPNAPIVVHLNMPDGRVSSRMSLPGVAVLGLPPLP